MSSSSVFSLTNSKPSVLLFNNKFFIEAFILNKKQTKLFVKKAQIRMQQYSKGINMFAWYCKAWLQILCILCLKVIVYVEHIFKIFVVLKFLTDCWSVGRWWVHLVGGHFRADEMDFKVEGPWNAEKCCRPPWLTEKENFWILDALEWLKQ